MNRLKHKNPCGNQRGIAMATGLMLTAILSILGVTALVTTSNELAVSKKFEISRSAFYNAEGGIHEARARLKGISVSADFAGDPAAVPDPKWNAHIFTDVAAPGTMYPRLDYKNFIPTPGSAPDLNNLTPVVNTIRPDLPDGITYWVEIRHKRECDAVLAGHVSGTSEHYIDNGAPPSGSDCTDADADNDGQIIFYGYPDALSTLQVEFSHPGNPARARPVEILRSFGRSHGSNKVVEVEVARNMGPNVNAALYGGDVGGNTTVQIYGEDGCGVGPPVWAAAYTNSSTWDPYPPPIGTITLFPAAKAIDQVPDKNIQAMIDTLKGDADIEIAEDENNAVVGGPDSYEIVYVNARGLNPDHEVDFHNLTGYGTLLIDGDARFEGSLDWTGLILISGNAVFDGGTGSQNVHGAVWVESTVDMNGPMEIHYDSCKIKAGLSKVSVAILRWRDRNGTAALK